MKTGGKTLALTREEYRQELRRGLERYGDKIKELPWGAGSGLVDGVMKGHFFCAKVGEDRVFLRFVPLKSDEIVKDTLGCLRLIACKDDTPRALPSELHDGAFPAWKRARHDIYEEWKFATDPANLQPRVRPALKKAAEHIRKYPPVGLNQVEIDRLVESIEAPWGGIEREIRECIENQSGFEASSALANKVKELGLEPFQPAEPLPRIVEDEIRLVCWMAVDTITVSKE